MSGTPPPHAAPGADGAHRALLPRSLYSQLAVFALIGVGNATVDGLIFTFFVTVLDWRTGIEPLAASVIGFVGGATHSYAWNSRVTFGAGRDRDSATQVGQFFSVAAGGAAVSAVAFSIVRSLWPDPSTVLAASKLGAIAVGMVWNFSLLRGWVFSQRRRRRPAAGDQREEAP